MTGRFFERASFGSHSPLAARCAAVSVRRMRVYLLGLVMICGFVVAGAGCASREKKPHSQIYAGDSPSITYTSSREAAGGPVGGR